MAHLVVDFQLVLEHAVPPFIDLISSIAVVLLPGIYRAPLSVPDTETVSVHPFSLLFIATSQPPKLRLIADILLWRSGKAEKRVVVNGVRAVLPAFVGFSEMREVGCEGVAIEENGVVRIDCTDSLVHTVVESDHASVVRVRWLVQRVVPSEPRVACIMLRELFPKPNRAVLEVFVDPEASDMCPVIRVPVGVLSSGNSVEIQDGIDSVLRTQINDSIKVLEALFLQHSRVQVILIKVSLRYPFEMKC